MKKLILCSLFYSLLFLGISCKHSSTTNTPPGTTPSDNNKVLTQEEVAPVPAPVVTDPEIVQSIQKAVETQIPDQQPSQTSYIRVLGHDRYSIQMTDGTYRIIKGIYGTVNPTPYLEVDPVVEEIYPLDSTTSYAIRVRTAEDGKYAVLDDNLNTLVPSSRFEKISRFEKLSTLGLASAKDIYVAKAENTSGSVEFINIKGESTDDYFSRTEPNYTDYIVFSYDKFTKECGVTLYNLNGQKSGDNIGKMFHSYSRAYQITLESMSGVNETKSGYSENCETLSSWVNNFLNSNAGIPRDITIKLVDKDDVKVHYDY